MNSEDIIKFLKSEPLKFTYSEIEQMMDEELSKAPEEMDTAFVDLCADVLCKALEANKENELNNKSKKKKHLKITKIIAIAAVLAVIFGFAVPVSAKYVHNDTSEKIVQFYEDHFSVNLKNAEKNAHKYSDANSDLINELKGSGLDNIILPSALFENDYTYTADVIDEEDFLTVYIDFKSNDDIPIIGVTVIKHKNGIENLFDNDVQFSAVYDSAKQLSLNGIDILIFGNKDYSSIYYVDENIEYNINLNDCSFDSAVEIAETLK